MSASYSVRGKFAEDPFLYGAGISLALHFFIAVGSIVFFEHKRSSFNAAPEVFTVTLEGGEVLGGKSQVPKDLNNAKKPVVNSEKVQEEPTKVPEKAEKTEPVKEKTPEVKPEKPLEVPSAVEDPEKLKREKERKEKIEEQKKKAEEEKKKEEDEKKKAQLEKQQDKKANEKKLSDIISKHRKNYEGESAAAGGEGFGAARLGGKGMGGGTLASVEKIAYANALQEHVKSGWRWVTSSDRLRALVRVRILPSGQIADVQIEQSSGNGNFDDSVVRAVRKADPVPPPPEKFYEDFSDVRFWFDSHEQG